MPASLARADCAGGGGVSAAWLSAAVEAAVRHIGAHAASGDAALARPFLLLVSPRPGVAFSAMPLSEADTAAGWAGVAAKVGGGAAQGMLLVQPLPEGEGGGEPADACVASRLQRSASASAAPHAAGGGANPTCSDCAAATARAAGAAPRAAGALISGRVGKCCDGDGVDDGARAAAAAAAAAAPVACALHQQGRPAFYGVVVQGPRSDTPDGCYLLKTTHAASAALGCACSHYSLTRVSKGPALHEQLTRSWTV